MKAKLSRTSIRDRRLQGHNEGLVLADGVTNAVQHAFHHPLHIVREGLEFVNGVTRFDSIASEVGDVHSRGVSEPFG